MHFYNRQSPRISDTGSNPLVIDMRAASECNRAFRTALWTGDYLQCTLMQINPSCDVGTEVHPHTDQYITVSEGCGRVFIGESRESMHFCRQISAGYGIFIPAGCWHNIVNTERVPMKLISIYAPPHHPQGTVHKTKKDAIDAEK